MIILIKLSCWHHRRSRSVPDRSGWIDRASSPGPKPDPSRRGEAAGRLDRRGSGSASFARSCLRFVDNLAPVSGRSLLVGVGLDRLGHLRSRRPIPQIGTDQPPAITIDGGHAGSVCSDQGMGSNIRTESQDASSLAEFRGTSASIGITDREKDHSCGMPASALFPFVDNIGLPALPCPIPGFEGPRPTIPSTPRAWTSDAGGNFPGSRRHGHCGDCVVRGLP